MEKKLINKLHFYCVQANINLVEVAAQIFTELIRIKNYWLFLLSKTALEKKMGNTFLSEWIR